MVYKDKFILALEKIKRAKNILLITHNNPDGDALASICAMIELAINERKKFFAYCYDAPPAQFNFLPHLEKISHDRKKLIFPSYDLIIALDCGGVNRTRLVKELLERDEKQLVIEFDHHPKMDDYSDIEIRIPESSSTAEVLYDFFKTNKIRLNKNYANCILTGILTDTGNFLYPSTSDRTVKIASEMLICGAGFPAIIENTWRNRSLEGMKFLSKAINNLKINQQYKIAYTVLPYDAVNKTNFEDEEFTNIVGFLSNLRGVNGLLVMREEKRGTIKGNLRTTHPNIDISKLAMRLGGGGHPKSSGFVISGSIVETENGWKIA